jgi:hypothetical protein
VARITSAERFYDSRPTERDMIVGKLQRQNDCCKRIMGIDFVSA